MTRTAAQAAYELFKHLPSWEVLFRAYRLWWYNKFPSEIDHEQIVGAVIEDGRMTSRYSFMVTMACAIAILGLLLSSPAVIIGAMLISPLMGPIMSLGFSLCIMDFKQMKKALEAIVIGMLLALMISSVIVHVSPLSDPTPEIMARTQPNLFDLLVAIFQDWLVATPLSGKKAERLSGLPLPQPLCLRLPWSGTEFPPPLGPSPKVHFFCL